MDKPWFAAKRYGIGSGRPIAWRGWAVSVLFFGAFTADMLLSPPKAPGRLWIAGILMVAYVVVAAAKTEGGWRWHWGGKD